MPLLLGWTGMRGVVSLAAALAIPVTLADGSNFPYRNLILFITFVVILLTLVVQGLTLPYLIRRSNLFDAMMKDESEEQTKQKMKQGLKQHVHDFLKDNYGDELSNHPLLEKMMKQWEERAKGADNGSMNEKTKAMFVALLESQRKYLTKLNNDPSIDEAIIRQQLYQLDLEEERIKTI